MVNGQIQIAVGQIWRTADNREAEVVARTEVTAFPWRMCVKGTGHNTVYTVTEDGTTYLGTPRLAPTDLVKLLRQPEPPCGQGLEHPDLCRCIPGDVGGVLLAAGDSHEATTFAPLQVTMEEQPWIEWPGGACPVDPLTNVLVVFGDGYATGIVVAEAFHWGREAGINPIVKYRLATQREIEIAEAGWPKGGDIGINETTEPGDFNPGTAMNPKDAVGSLKLPIHLWPAEATAMGCLGMLEGKSKYGRNNMIAGQGVVASIYVDAAMRHLQAWFEGEENAHDTGTPHLANALATIAIIVKCQAHNKLIDDRNYSPVPNGSLYRAFIERLTPHVKRIQQLFADKTPRHFTIADVQRMAAEDTEGGAA